MSFFSALSQLFASIILLLSFPALAAPERTVLAFGDSLTAGYRLRADQSFPAQLEASLRGEGRTVRVINAGVSGETTSGGRNRLARTLDGLKQKPDVAILELGANDMLRMFDPRTTRANLDAMLTEFNRRGIPVILAGMFTSTGLGIRYLDAFNDIYPDLAKKHGVTLYPFFLKGVVFNAALLLDDGIHPNREGVALITKNILPTVRKMLDGLPAPKVAPAVTVPAGSTDAPAVRRN